MSSAYDELIDDIITIKETEESLNIDFILEDLDELMSDSSDGIERVSKILVLSRIYC